MQDEDRSIMKRFANMRLEINKIKENRNQILPRRASFDIPRISEDDELSGARACNKDPFDIDDDIPLRRRAITTMEFGSSRIIDDDIRLRYQTR